MLRGKSRVSGTDRTSSVRNCRRVSPAVLGACGEERRSESTAQTELTAVGSLELWFGASGGFGLVWFGF